MYILPFDKHSDYCPAFKAHTPVSLERGWLLAFAYLFCEYHHDFACFAGGYGPTPVVGFGVAELVQMFDGAFDGLGGAK